MTIKDSERFVGASPIGVVEVYHEGKQLWSYRFASKKKRWGYYRTKYDALLSAAHHKGRSGAQAAWRRVGSTP